jgi:hypothetical protein
MGINISVKSPATIFREEEINTENQGNWYKPTKLHGVTSLTNIILLQATVC